MSSKLHITRIVPWLLAGSLIGCAASGRLASRAAPNDIISAIQGVCYAAN